MVTTPMAYAPYGRGLKKKFDGPEEKETPLPIAPVMIPTEILIPENVAEKTITLDALLKIKVSELKNATNA